MPKELWDGAVDLVGETDLAYRVDDGGTNGPQWVPKSQCELEKNPDGTHTLTCPMWLAKDKGFI